MPMRPLRDTVLILRDEAPNKSAGGVFMPDTAEEKPSKGTVTAVGRLVEELQVGDIVTISQFLGTELNEDGKDFVLASEKHVLVVHDA